MARSVQGSARFTRLRNVAPLASVHLTAIAVWAKERALVGLVTNISAIVGAAAGVVCAIPIMIKWVRRW